MELEFASTEKIVRFEEWNMLYRGYKGTIIWLLGSVYGSRYRVTYTEQNVLLVQERSVPAYKALVQII